MEKPEKRKRGLACLSPERRSEIARMGGKSVPPEKRAFSRNAALAAEAGRIGGSAVPAEHRMFRQDNELARRAAKASAVSRAKKPE